MAGRKVKTPPTVEEQRDKLERKVRRLEVQVVRLEVTAKVEAEYRERERKEQEEELSTYRHFIIDQLRDPLPWLIQLFTTDKRHLALFKDSPYSKVADPSAERDLIDCIVEAAEPHAFRVGEPSLRALCPLCGCKPRGPYSMGGYALPTGLERHLTGWGNAHQCLVMQVIRAEARQDARRVIADPHLMQMRAERQRPKEASPEKAATPILSGVRPCAEQRDLPEEQVTVWEISSVGEDQDGPYAMQIPERTGWVKGTKVQAGYIRERWRVALRWHAIPRGTRFWAALCRGPRGLLIGAVLNNVDEEDPTIPTWDHHAKVWRGPEPVIVDSVEGFDWYEWERKQMATEARRAPEPSEQEGSS